MFHNFCTGFSFCGWLFGKRIEYGCMKNCSSEEEKNIYFSNFSSTGLQPARLTSGHGFSLSVHLSVCQFVSRELRNVNSFPTNKVFTLENWLQDVTFKLVKLENSINKLQFSYRVENIMVRVQSDGNQHVLLFPKCFKKSSPFGLFNLGCYA